MTTRSRSAARVRLALATLALVALAAARADAAAWISVGALAGAAAPDAALADYRWDGAARTGLGLQALAGHGRYAAGLRLWTTATTQTLGAGVTPESAEVGRASVELVGRATLLSRAGLALAATASAGGVRLAYDPARAEVATSGGPVPVALETVHEWIAGAGLAAGRAIGPRWRVGLEVERRFFALDTAHRNGGAIETGRETFGDWNARLEVARLFGRH